MESEKLPDFGRSIAHPLAGGLAGDGLRTFSAGFRDTGFDESYYEEAAGLLGTRHRRPLSASP